MNTNYITEKNAERPATKKQLWALYCITKKDYRGQDLTMLDASVLLSRLNKQATTELYQKARKASKEEKLEKEFIDYMTEKIQDVIAQCRKAMQVKSIVEDDTHIPENQRKRYAFVGFGCGFTIVNFDKRSNVGKQIKTLANKHRNTTFLRMFLKGFTTKEIKYFESIGCPLQALYNQDISINAKYEYAVAHFMEMKGVKNVTCRTYDD